MTSPLLGASTKLGLTRFGVKDGFLVEHRAVHRAEGVVGDGVFIHAAVEHVEL